MDAFELRTAAEIDHLVADDFDDEQRVAERVEELASRPNTAALQRPCTASVPSRTAQQPSVLVCLANITTRESETEESFYARIIQTARQQQQQQQPSEHRKEAKRASFGAQRREGRMHNSAQLAADEAPVDAKRESAVDVYVVPSRTHSPPLTDSRPSTSSSASRLSFASASSTSATPRSQHFDSALDGGNKARPTGSVSFASLSALDRDSWYVEQSQVKSVDAASDRPFSRRTSIRSRFPAIGK